VCLLKQVCYPHTSSSYQYERVQRNLPTGNFSCTDAFRVTARYDQEKRYDRSKGTWHLSGDINHVNYSYSQNDYTGPEGWSVYDLENYSQVWSDSPVPNTAYQFWSQATLSNGLSTRTIFNGLKQELQVETTAGNHEKKIIKNLEFDTRFRHKPTKTEISRYAADGTLASRLYVARTYNEHGVLASITKPLTAAQLADATIREQYTTSYEYDCYYKRWVTKKRWYQNRATPLEESYKYARSRGKVETAVNAKGETTNYSYHFDYHYGTVPDEKQNSTSCCRYSLNPKHSSIEVDKSASKNAIY